MYEVLRRGRFHNLSIECQLELFDTMVKPILLYGSEVWGFSKNIKSLETVHLKFCKLLLNLKSSTPNYMVYGELDRIPVELDIKNRMVSFWTRLLSGKNTKYSYLSYKLLYKLSVEEKMDFAWLKYIRKIFDDTGFTYVWTSQNFGTSDWLLESIKQRLQDHFIQYWYTTIENSSKAINYRIFKDKFEFEQYFNILIDKDIYTFCKFRTANHKLPIETGRWNNTERENRICTKCNSGDLGDEYHYIMECKHFENY